MAKKTIFKPLNTLRKFDGNSQIKDYFKFPTIDKDGNQSTYQMTDAQMTEWENAQLKKTMNNIIHQMRTVHKTIEPYKGKWK